MRFTRRASLMGAVALCFYLVAVVNTLPSFYYVLVWLAVGLLASSLGLAVLSLTGTGCRLRELRPYGYARGEFVSAMPPLWEAALGNVGSLNKTGIELELRLRRAGGAAPSAKRGRGKTPPLLAYFLVEALPSGAKLDAPLGLDFLPRGAYELTGARLIGSDVLGLFRASKRLSVPDALRVVVAPMVLPIGGGREFSRGAGGRDGSRTLARLGNSQDLRGVRPYVPGDDWRHIHWATSARTGELAVREFERSGRDAAVVVWDGALSATSGRGARPTTEEELTLVASLLCALDAAQTPAHVAVLGGEGDELIAVNGQDGLLASAAMEALARAVPARTVPLTTALDRASMSADGALGQFFFVSSSLGADLVECVAACMGRGEAVTVVWYEWASTPDPRRRMHRARDRKIEVAPPARSQEQALLATGARLVRVSLEEGQSVLPVLERALLELLEPM